jgi:hypothetical protein
MVTRASGHSIRIGLPPGAPAWEAAGLMKTSNGPLGNHGPVTFSAGVRARRAVLLCSPRSCALRSAQSLRLPAGEMGTRNQRSDMTR